MEHRIGIVKWVNATRGFGGILPSSGPELFFHFRDLIGVPTVAPQQQVSFAVQDDPGRPRQRAVSVQLVVSH